MELILRTGESITLDWNMIVLEYLEEYNGGIGQLRKDINNKNKRFRTFNFIIYCVMLASTKEELSYEDAISLVNINDYGKIIDFIIKNMSQIKKDNNKEKKINNKRIHFNRQHRR